MHRILSLAAAELQKTNWAGQAKGETIVFSLKWPGVTYTLQYFGHGVVIRSVPFGLVVSLKKKKPGLVQIRRCRKCCICLPENPNNLEKSTATPTNFSAQLEKLEARE